MGRIERHARGNRGKLSMIVQPVTSPTFKNESRRGGNEERWGKEGEVDDNSGYQLPCPGITGQKCQGRREKEAKKSMFYSAERVQPTAKSYLWLLIRSRGLRITKAEKKHIKGGKKKKECPAEEIVQKKVWSSTSGGARRGGVRKKRCHRESFLASPSHT